MNTLFLNSIDITLLHFFNDSNSLFLDNLVEILASGYTWIALYATLIYIVIKNNETMAQIWLVLGCSVLCLILTGGVDDLLVKPWVGRLRPTYDPAVKYTLHIVNGIHGGGQFGFFSAHATNTFSIALFMCYLVRSKLLNIALFTWCAINCWTRLYLGVHYPSDILVGVIYGFIVTTLVYILYVRVYNKITPKLNYISSQYTSTGYSKQNIDVVLTVLMLTYVYAICRAVIIFH